MNKVYKLVWSKVRNCYVVASELAKSHSKGKSRKTAVTRGMILPIVMGMVLCFDTSFVLAKIDDQTMFWWDQQSFAISNLIQNGTYDPYLEDFRNRNHVQNSASYSISS